MIQPSSNPRLYWPLMTFLEPFPLLLRVGYGHFPESYVTFSVTNHEPLDEVAEGDD